MIDSSITQLTKFVPVLEPEDTVRRAAGLMRSSEGSRLFVQSGGQIMGSVSERAIAGFLSGSDGSDSELDASVNQLIEPNQALVSSSLTMRGAAEVFASTGEDVLPVVDEYGGFRGAVYRRDLVGLLTKNLRPPTVAGMATPLGVYLTTGSVSGGVGSLGLYLTGVSLGLMMLIANYVVMGLQKAVTALTGIPVAILLRSQPLTYSPNVYDLALYLSVLLTVAVFLLLLRLSPLSGYHAAEHMTVHAIEAGETLTPERVRDMPRVHPRCGTNLLAAAGVFLIITSRFSGQLAVLLAMLVVVLGWRMVGGWLQYFVTTRNPSARQLANGVAAGNEVLENHRQRPGYQAVGFQRIWNLGFLQTAAGLFTVLWILQHVLKLPMLL